MAYEEKYRPVEAPHSVFLENRSKLSLTGVRDVERFDEEEIVVDTSQGTLIISGSGLHIEKLSLDSGEVTVQGVLSELKYEETVTSSGGFFSRMFKDK